MKFQLSDSAGDSLAIAIRDLDSDGFSDRYCCDRFSATVISHRLQFITEHMCGGLLTNAFSPILRDWYDFAAVVSGSASANFPLAAVSNSLVLFVGTMADAVRNTIMEYGVDRLEVGDIIIGNDPYRKGTHINDVLFCRPVMVNGVAVAFVSIAAHQLDMGGTVPGGFSATKRDVYHNGLTLSPRALFRRDEMVQETWSLIFDNVRFGEVIFPDIETICQNLRLGERLFLDTIERYGCDSVAGAIEYVCDESAERMSDALGALPDGEWIAEDVVDADGVDEEEEYRVAVKVVKRGNSAEVDLSGTSRQARTCINASVLDAKTAVAVAFKYLLDPEGSFNSGTMRPIDIVLPQGTLLSALPPDGAVFLYWEASNALVSALLRALAPVMGRAAIAGDVASANLHNAHGVLKDGVPWVSVAQCGGEHGPWGATAFGDGDSYTVHFQANNIDPAIEAIEADYPVAIMRRDYVPDTGGPGEYRGGAAVRKDSLWLMPAEHHSMPLRFRRASGFGVYGGRDGMTGGVWMWASRGGKELRVGVDAGSYAGATAVAGVLNRETNLPDRLGEYVYFARVPVWRSDAMATFRYITNGGGGWGDPLERDPEAVCRDVRDGYVTIEGARRDYGVVVRGDPEWEPEELVLDRDATARVRKSRL